MWGGGGSCVVFVFVCLLFLLCVYVFNARFSLYFIDITVNILFCTALYTAFYNV